MDAQDNASYATSLRQRAEELLRSRPAGSQGYSLEDIHHLLHELSVYQTELEIQNEELRKSQQALQESHNRYQDLYDFAPAGYVTLGQTGLIEASNLAASALLGIERRELLRRPFTSFVAAPDQDTYYLYRRQLTSTGQPQVGELRLQRADGSIFHARLESMLLDDEDHPQPQYRVAMIDISKRVAAETALRQAHDQLEARVQERTAELLAANHALQTEIAERRRAEAALRSSEERFRVVLKDSPITVFNQDETLCYTWVYNPIPPLTPEEVLGRTNQELLAFDEAATLGDLARAALRTGESQRAEVPITLAGQVRWYDLRVEPLRDQDRAIIGITGVLTDVTAYHRAMDEQRLLAQVSTQFITALDLISMLQHVAQTVVNAVSDWCIIALLGEERPIDPAIVKHRDARREALLAAWFVETLTDPAANHPLVQVAQDGQALVFPELPTAQDRQRGLISLIGVPLVARGRTIGAIGLLTDQSGQRYSADDLRLAEELARRVALAIDNTRLHSATQRARTEAEAALRMRDQVFQLISHDLRAPLAAIEGYAHLLKRRITAAQVADPKQLIKGLANIEIATSRMASQIQELLDVASLQAGRALSLNWGTVDLLDLVRRTVEAAQDLSSQHTLRVATAETDLPCVGDELRLERVCTNLLSNAIKYSPDGSEVLVRLACEAQDGADWALLAVQDTGIGIPADDIPRLFTPFYRAGNISSTMPGTGLGLASVRQIIEQHGGSIDVASEEGAGSTFTIRLPLARG